MIDCSRIHYLRNQILLHCSWWSSAHIASDWCPASTKEALEQTPPWTFEAPVQFDFYTDGSFLPSRDAAAAGAVLVVQTTAGSRFGGYQTTACSGAPSAPRAEATAILLALRWACALVHQAHYDTFPIVFHYDSVYAGNAAQGKCLSTLNQDLTHIVRSLSLWLEQLTYVTLEWQHVRGHSGDPWKDLADAVSVQAVRSAVHTHDLCDIICASTFEGDDLHSVQWLWLSERSLQGRPDAPLLHGLQWKFNTRAPLTSAPDLLLQPWMRRQQRHHSPPAYAETITLRVATANVLTLYPAQSHASSFLGARAESLETQFRSSGLHCVGLQETRCHRQGYVDFGHFHILSSSATQQGHGGVQLWIAKKIKAGDAAISLATEHLRILHGDERRLIVCLRHAHLRLLLLVLHAPCHDRAEELAAWWTLTSSLIPSSFASWTWILLCDAISRLGSVVTPSVESFGAEDENVKGAHFHEWLVHHNLWLPQTFESAHHGSHFTWTHASQGVGRLDYVGLSTNVSMEHACTWIDTNIDLSLARSDHECVCADVTLPMLFSKDSEHERVASVQGRQPVWHDDVHTHAALMQINFEANVPVSSRDRLRKKHLTDETLELIRIKKQRLRRLRRVRLDWRQYCLRRIFDGLRAPHLSQSDDRGTITSLFSNLAFAEEHYRVASLQVCSAVRRDDRIFFQDLAEETGRVAQTGFHRIWDAIKPLLPKWKNRRQHNLRCLGPTAAQQAEHYCALEGGAAVPYADLLEECHRMQASQSEDLPLVIRLDQIPTRIDIEHRLQQISANRAPGVDGLKPGPIREAGPMFSDAVCQLMIKDVAHRT
eukprot:s3226_g16.t1